MFLKTYCSTQSRFSRMLQPVLWLPKAPPGVAPSPANTSLDAHVPSIAKLTALLEFQSLQLSETSQSKVAG